MKKRQMLSRVVATTSKSFGSDRMGNLAASADDVTCASDGRSIALYFAATADDITFASDGR